MARFYACRILAVLVFISGAAAVSAQKTDSVAQTLFFRGSVSATNNGFSFIPSFSLGKPAVVFNFNVNTGKRFSFEPEFRFSLLDAKPWSFIFIWRYKVINRPAFQLTAGSHLPAIPFRTITYVKNGVEHETLANYRFLPFELSPNLRINKNVSVSAFYLYAYGFDDATRHTHFLSLRSNISNIPLFKSFLLRLYPQFFYLRLDDKDGFYTAANIFVYKKGVPFSISAMLNKPIKKNNDIATKSFDWNLSLVYSFGKDYVRK